MDAYWRAANYLSVGQIYLMGNPLLREKLQREHVKPRLLGHWGTTPGLNFIYVHLNRLIRERDLDMIFVTGPGHGGPALVACTWLEGTYSELYPDVSQDAEGMRRPFEQFSFPGGVPSHCAPETPGSIHEGGELGYALAHAYGAVLDNPGLVACCVVGDGEAETGPLAASWHSNKFLNPAADGAVLPILHLNGWKIANPTVLDRIGRDELTALLRGYGHEPHYVEGHEPERMHREMAETLEGVMDEIRSIQREAREDGRAARRRWPMIVLRTPKGWTGPGKVDGVQVEGTWRSHQVPLSAKVRDEPKQLKLLEQWLRSYRPEELFDEDGVLGGFLRDVMKLNAEAEELPRVRAGRDRLQPARRPLRGDGQGLHGRDPRGRRAHRPGRAGDGGALRAPTLETLAATDLLRQHFPEIKVRVVNVVDLMTLQPESEHPHGLSDRDFDSIFTVDKSILFAYHGYPWLIHRLTYRRTNHRNLHVRGYKEEGTTTTPFDMVVMNDLDRFHLVADVIDRVPKLGHRAAYARQAIWNKRVDHKQYIHRMGEDMPEIRNWTWPY